MTEALYHTDSYLKWFDAVVTAVDGHGVVLDRTGFYPGGGGQPADRGLLRVGDRAYPVVGMARRQGQVVHELDAPPAPEGTALIGVIDWERRYRLMRTHTALHLLCGVVWRDYGALVTGGDMQPLQARMDFELEQMSTEFAHEIEAKVNREVELSHPVTAALLPREEAMAIPDLIRTKINLLPPAIQEVRVVEIRELDLQADGGTHVANTREVGRVRVVGHESKGRINKRLRIELDE